MKILDCTLRDGGYYTNWDFDDKTVDAYIEAMNVLPIDYLELGYRNLPSSEYLGKFGYCPVSVLKNIRSKCSKKLVVMLNEKSTRPEDLPELLQPIIGFVDMIRLAIDPKNFDRALILAKAVKSMGFEVGFNTMYMSKWSEYEGFLDKLSMLNGVADLFCMVDSFGGVMPDDVREMTHLVKSKTDCHIGFHGHNNLQMGLINTLVAIEEGCEFVDATILGMGRGAGNLNMELLLTALNKQGLDVDFNVLSDVVAAFQPLMKKHQWGTALPYMLSGANSIPQKEVMDWVCNRVYSFNSIIRALNNKKNHVADNARYPIWKAPHAEQVLIIGGGPTVIEHKDAIIEFLRKYPTTVLVFATARHAELFVDICNPKVYCLVGSEAKRMTQTVRAEQFDGIVVLPPYPRTMGTDVPSYAENSTYELPEIAFSKEYLDSCTAISLKVSIEMQAKRTYIVGYDGYRGGVLSEKEMELTNENRTLFDAYKQFTGVSLVSLTPSIYTSLEVKSIYQFI
ncbi:MAG: hypothetical protein HUK00_00135 [Bacteroidaceae bacterium]|nr:hypothetical protein [Bacteroidaceae bacterium]